MTALAHQAACGCPDRPLLLLLGAIGVFLAGVVSAYYWRSWRAWRGRRAAREQRERLR